MARQFNLVLLLALGAYAVRDDDVFGTADDITIDPTQYQCAKFSDIFTGGEQMCNSMWGSSFYYEPNETVAYTWWFFDADNNPNDAATLARGLQVPDSCNVTYSHKSHPSPEGDDFTECHPWRENACCHEATVTTPYHLNTFYGPGYRWDRCGALSQACERFFVAEACFYECDVNAGHFRTFSDAEVAACTDDWCADNTWSVTGIPVKASYCDAFYAACHGDYFHSSGDYWTAYEEYTSAYEAEAAARLKERNKKDTEMPTWGVPVIIAACAVAVLGCIFVAVLVQKEKAGEPLFFQPLPNADSDGYPKEVPVTELTSNEGKKNDAEA